MGRSIKQSLLVVFAGGLLLAAYAPARAAQQDQQDQQGASTAAPSQEAPSQDQSGGKKSKTKQPSNNQLLKEIDKQYQKWLNEDVVYIISPEERNAFLHLQTNEEREQFIEAFWQRRNPDPDSPENTFKEEHYRRIAYANEHFASGVPGWKTDRGRIYIAWGPPDERDEHTSGEQYDRPMDQGGGTTTTYAYETWRYRYAEGLGENFEMEFVDPTGTGEFHLTMDPSEKDALLNVPGAGLTMPEQMGMADKSMRFSNTDGTHLAGQGEGVSQGSELDEFTRLENYAKAFTPPPVKFKDLEADVSSRLVRDQLKYDYRFDFLRITSDTVLVPITVQIPTRQLTFQEKNGVDEATLNVFARVTSLSGRVIQTFEDTLKDDQPASLLQQSLATSQIYQKQVPLSPGLYKLDIVVKDVNSGNVGVVDTRLPVPRYQEDTMSASSLILSDEIAPVSAKDIGLGQFVLGDLKIRPKMDSTFTTADPMGVYLQVYNLKVDDKTHKADASVEYRVMKEKETTPILKFDQTSDKMPQHGEELTLANVITLGSLAPGKYTLEVAITDNLAKQTITPTTNFTVKSVPATAAQGR
jgi:GWxTD domain-containing protein